MGFFELLVVALVGLFVIGPEKLPHTIRVLALWIGRIKRSIVETRREIEEQIGADEIRRELHNEQVMRNWEKMKEVREELEAKINALGQLPQPGEPPQPAPPPSESASSQPLPTAAEPDPHTIHTSAPDAAAAAEVPVPAEPAPAAPAEPSAEPAKQVNP